MTDKKKTSCLVLFSAGQDSTTLLGYAKNHFDYVEAISFNYGQQHSIELEQGAKICAKLGIKRTLIDITFMKDICDSALTTVNGDVSVAHGRMKNLPASFVPNRNLILLTLANTYAQKIGITNLMTGTCETDSSGYPDCRRLFIDGAESTLFAASSKSELSVDYIRQLLSIYNTTYKIVGEVDCTPKITIEDSEEALTAVNEFFGNIATYDGFKEELIFSGFEACSYVFNLVKDCDHKHSLEQRDDYSLFKDAFEGVLSEVNPHNVSPSESNFFVKIHTPLMYLNKAETFELAEQENILETVLEDSHTCYVGDRTTRHDYGYGCDTCPACVLRKKGYEEYLLTNNLSKN